MQIERLFNQLARPAQRAILGAGITSLEQLSKKTQAEVAAWHGIGKKAMATIQAVLQEHGLSLAARAAGLILRMTAEDVIEIVRLFEQHQIEIIIDGGWAVDAVLTRQTRPHTDLDIAIWHKDTPQVRAMLAERGFEEVPLDDSWECNYVLGDAGGRRVDVHSCTFDESGSNVFGVPYPLASWQGRGVIAGVPVRCVPPDWLVQFHTGYPIDEGDYRDVIALCEQFGLALPADYARFEPGAAPAAS